jgi:hypothetical protein
VSTERQLARIGAVAATTGTVILLVATSMPPMSADPNDPAAAFADYAADSWWVATLWVFILGIVMWPRRAPPDTVLR